MQTNEYSLRKPDHAINREFFQKKQFKVSLKKKKKFFLIFLLKTYIVARRF